MSWVTSRARPDIVALEPYRHAAWEPGLARLHANELPWRTPRDDSQHGLNRYPEPQPRALIERLAALYRSPTETLLATRGSDEAIDLLTRAFCRAGEDAVVVCPPTFGMYAAAARIQGARVVGVPLLSERGFALDAHAVLRACGSDVKLVFLCSPNNPTGMLEPDEVVEGVLAAAPGLVVVDEAYGQFAPRSHVAAIADDAPLVVTRTFSKTWSLAALRLGYCIAPVDVVRALEQVALPYHLDAAKQLAGRLALRFVAEMEARVAALVEERGRLMAGLAELPVDVWPSAANYVLFRPRPVDGHVAWQGLVDRSVLVRNCASWPRLGGCLRVTVGTPDENDAFLKALDEVLS